MASPRVALVTGGSRGIGAASALALAAAGWDVAVSYRERSDRAEEVVDGCRQLGRRAEAFQADLSEPADIDELFRAADDLGSLGLLVNNAGMAPPASRVDELTAERIDSLLRVNVMGVLLAAGAAVRRMSTAHGGSGGVVVNISSRAAVLGGPSEYVDYAASKAAVDALTRGLALEVAKESVRVVGIRPGLIETEIHAPGRLERLLTAPPVGRPGTAEEVAAAVVWLASPAASYVTGTTLDVSGGR